MGPSHAVTLGESAVGIFPICPARTPSSTQSNVSITNAGAMMIFLILLPITSAVAMSLYPRLLGDYLALRYPNIIPQLLTLLFMSGVRTILDTVLARSM